MFMFGSKNRLKSFKFFLTYKWYNFLYLIIFIFLFTILRVFSIIIYLFSIIIYSYMVKYNYSIYPPIILKGSKAIIFFKRIVLIEPIYAAAEIALENKELITTISFKSSILYFYIILRWFWYGYWAQIFFFCICVLELENYNNQESIISEYNIYKIWVNALWDYYYSPVGEDSFFSD